MAKSFIGFVHNGHMNTDIGIFASQGFFDWERSVSKTLC